MTDSGYTTITVREQTKERLDEHRDGQKWDEYLEMLRREHADPITVNDVEELADLLVDTIGAEAGGPAVDDSEIAREVARQLDYTALADKVADEVVGRLR